MKAPLLATPNLIPQTPHVDVPPLKSLLGTDIGDIVWSGRHLWIATERGLARLDPRISLGNNASDWVTFTIANGLGRGAISALAAIGDTIWAATVFDSTIADETFQAGSGLSFSLDSGETWKHLPAETIFDATRASFSRVAGTVINNVCFGLAIDDETIWATFFAESLVRSHDAGRTWERILPDGTDEIIYYERENKADDASLQHLVHRTFSTIAYQDTVWIGTAAGLASSFDGGETWRRSRPGFAQNGQLLDGTLSANWIVALGRQLLNNGQSIIWVGARVGTQSSEQARIKFSRNNGFSWDSSGPTSAWGFAFNFDTAWATTNDDLLRSRDGGLTWEIVDVIDLQSGGKSLRGPFIGVDITPDLSGGRVLWVGGENGLARAIIVDNYGEAVDRLEWQILSYPLKTRSIDKGGIIGDGGIVDPDSVSTYSAPNPFYPRTGQKTRIVFSLHNPAIISIDIYDFSSRLVRSLVDSKEFAGQENYQELWDGLDNRGHLVANGIYFFRVMTINGHKAFGKIVVLH